MSSVQGFKNGTILIRITVFVRCENAEKINGFKAAFQQRFNTNGVIAGPPRKRRDPVIHDSGSATEALRKIGVYRAVSWIPGSRRHSASKTRVNALMAAARV